MLLNVDPVIVRIDGKWTEFTEIDVYQKYNDFHHVATLITMIESSFLKKTREEIMLSELKYNFSDRCHTLPPVPVSTRWNSWIEAAVYHATRVHTY